MAKLSASADYWWSATRTSFYALEDHVKRQGLAVSIQDLAELKGVIDKVLLLSALAEESALRTSTEDEYQDDAMTEPSPGSDFGDDGGDGGAAFLSSDDQEEDPYSPPAKRSRTVETNARVDVSSVVMRAKEGAPALVSPRLEQSSIWRPFAFQRASSQITPATGIAVQPPSKKTVSPAAMGTLETVVVSPLDNRDGTDVAVASRAPVTPAVPDAAAPAAFSTESSGLASEASTQSDVRSPHTDTAPSPMQQSPAEIPPSNTNASAAAPAVAVFSPQEDDWILCEYIESCKEGSNWNRQCRELAAAMKGRTARDIKSRLAHIIEQQKAAREAPTTNQIAVAARAVDSGAVTAYVHAAATPADAAPLSGFGEPSLDAAADHHEASYDDFALAEESSSCTHALKQELNDLPPFRDFFAMYGMLAVDETAAGASWETAVDLRGMGGEARPARLTMWDLTADSDEDSGSGDEEL